MAPGAGPDRSTIPDAFRLLRAAAPGLEEGGGRGRLGGRRPSRGSAGSFGLGGLAAGADPASGGLAGLAKTAGHEWPEVDCKAIDLDPSMPGRRGRRGDRRGDVPPGAVRGRARGGGPGRDRAPVGAAAPAPAGPGRSRRGDVVVVTGGARGVTAEVAVALAGAFRPTLVLLGRSAEPTAEPDWLAPLRDEAEIKRALHAQARGPATPQAIGEHVPQDRGQPRGPGQPPADRAGRGAGRLSVARRPRPRGGPLAPSRRSGPSSGRSAASSTAPGSWPIAGSRTRPTSSSPGSSRPRSTGWTRCSGRSGRTSSGRWSCSRPRRPGSAGRGRWPTRRPTRS